MPGLGDAIVERSDEAKRAYADGYKAGWEWALNAIRRGDPPQRIEDQGFRIYEMLHECLKS
jgi:hypothetical protein